MTVTRQSPGQEWRKHAARRARNRKPTPLVQQRMEDQGKPILSAGEARQAVRGQGVRYVLAISVALAVVAMLIAYFVA